MKPNTSVSTSWRSAPGPGGSYNASNVTLPVVIRFAYDIQDYQLAGRPGWMQSERFDIAARAGRDVPNAELRLMVQSLLADRFKLTVRREQREMAQYALVHARSDGRYGPDLLRVPVEDCSSPEARATASARPAPAAMSGGSAISGSCGPISAIARILGGRVGAPVADKTGLSGNWSFLIRFRSDDLAAPDANLPSLFDALQEQLGLKLERTRGPVEVLVIDSVQLPTPD